MKENLFSIFDFYPGLIATLSTKQDGSMSLRGVIEQDQTIIANRNNFLTKLGINSKQVVSADLGHSNTVKVVSPNHSGTIISNSDGLLTENKNLFLSITLADCLPIFIYDPNQKVMGLVHGGWRNLAKGILTTTTKKLKTDFNSKPQHILVGIGPGISQCHYEVKQDVISKFEPFVSEAAVERDGRTFLDLKRIALLQLLELGFEQENVEIDPECTYCFDNKYFSYRRDKKPSGKIANQSIKTMMAVIGRIYN